ncbi:hypothetical protein CPAV1605_811 [seawater metagenome]|uniref:2-cysteine adaptor domain-containing protein n=1 Tax=seawater metagenome TaxID=1561972 RepID=A0A5E8CIZ4_9ZZZZ
MSYNKILPTHDELKLWNKNRTVNPRTKRKIKENGPIYRILIKNWKKLKIPEIVIEDEDNVDAYSEYRKNKIDPILMVDLPIEEDKKYFEFKYKWNPYTGERLGIDKNGPLCFDPDTLIYYFYNNRLNYLWEAANDINYTGYFGDALGNGPEFEIKGRGKHPDWYLFRLPIHDCYLNKDHCHQAVTMGPILTDKELKEIDKLAKKYKNNFKGKFKVKRPQLFKMKTFYEQAISQNPNINIEPEVIPFVDPIFVKKLKHNLNVKAVHKLINM